MILDFKELDLFRISQGPLSSDPKDQTSKRSGAFSFIVKGMPVNIIVIADAGDNDETGWERVSITVQCMRRVKGKKKRQIADRPPSHSEILQIKDVFWPPSETVFQYYGNDINDPSKLTIELWRKKDGQMTIPYTEAVEPINDNTEDNEHGDKGNNERGSSESTSPTATDQVGGDRPDEAVSGEEKQVSEHNSDSDTGE